jgi:FAD/FMN-containing dehydrogenase
MTVARSRWSELARLGAGTLRRPGEPGFAAVTEANNKRYAEVRPAAVLSVTSAGDVARAVGWAREHDVPFAVRGRGHSYAGGSVGPGLTLDVGGLGGVEADPATGRVTVGGGTRMAALADELAKHGLVLPLGNADDVGVGGLILGGGVAGVSRVYGLTCDALLETEVVLADGSVVTCSEREHPDLFWACRGAGGGTFGVHTSFTLQARPVPAISTFLVVWPWPEAVAVFTAAQRLLAGAPDRLSARIGAARSPEGWVSVAGQYLGPAAELRELLAPVLAAARPVKTEIIEQDFWAARRYRKHATTADAFAVRSRFARAPLPAEAVAAAIATIDRWPGSNCPDGAGIAMFSWGGAINRVPAGATAFPHRDTMFLVSVDTSWTVEDSPGVVAANLGWLHELYGQLGTVTGTDAYVNFPDPDLADWRTAYYGPGLARLADVKRRYDPDRVFDHAQAV